MEECPTGPHLFPQTNETEEIFAKLTEFRRAYQQYHAYICLFICSLGVLTNIINIMVLTKRQMRTSINIILTGIAVCDMGTMLSYLIYIVKFSMATDFCDPLLFSYGWMFWLLCHMMISVALHTSSLWLAVAMALVRKMTLKEARLGSPWLNRDNAWKICFVVYSSVFAMCIPTIFSQGIFEWTETFNATCWEKVAQGQYSAYTIGIPNCSIYRVNLWINGIMFKTVPCILLAYFSVNLLFTIKRVHRHRSALLIDQTRNLNKKDANKKPVKSDRTTLMLVVILFVFLLTELPQGAVALMSGVFVRDVQMYIYNNLGDVLDLLSLFNSSINFFLYCTMSAKYRQVFWQVLLPKKIYIQWYIRGKAVSAPSVTNGNRVASTSFGGTDANASQLKKLFRRTTKGKSPEAEDTMLTEESPQLLLAKRDRRSLLAKQPNFNEKVMNPFWLRILTLSAEE